MAIGPILLRPITPEEAAPPDFPPPSVYEDFKPKTEWQQDKESNTLLLIYLPGFEKENIKISTEGKNVLKASGETIIGVNKWSRFQEVFPLPEDDYNVIGNRSNFEGGILTITIPRKQESSIINVTHPENQKQPAAVPQKTQQDDAGCPIGFPSIRESRTSPADKRDPKNILKEKMEESDDYQKEKGGAASSSSTSGYDYSQPVMSYYKQTLSKLMERKLVVNIGATVLVIIVAFGAYLSYTRSEEAEK